MSKTHRPAGARAGVGVGAGGAASAARRGGVSRDLPRRRKPSPPTLIGGESPKAQAGAKVDWLTLTFTPESPDLAVEIEILDLLRHHLGNISGVSCAGLLGYERGFKFFNADGIHIARVDYGGNHYKGRARLDISGTGCAGITDWEHFAKYAANNFFALTLTRVDLAVDMLNGEYTVDDARDWYEQGTFNAGGRMPKHSCIGSWLTASPEAGEGRTLLIGKRGNGKMLRAYEKGRQLGDPDSPWVRFEVEFRNIDRDLPLDILTDCNKYFTGAYKALEQIIDCAAERIATHQKEGEISLQHLIDYARQSYGKTISVMRLVMKNDEVMDRLTVHGTPKRLEKAAVSGFLQKPFPAGERYETGTKRL